MKFQAAGKSLEEGWGWVIVFSSFVVYFIVFGSLRCQSVLFVPIMNEYNSDYSTVGWVSATATAGLAISGIISAYMMAKVGHRTTVIFGGVLACVASIASVFAPTIAIFNMTAGFITGVGLGISFVAAPVMIGLYFKKRRAFATNLASMGASVGAFALCPLNGILLEVFTLPGYYLLLGGIFLQMSVVGALMRPVSYPTLKSKNIPQPKKKLTNLDEGFEEAMTDRDIETVSIHNQSDEINQQQPKPVVVLFKSVPFFIFCLSQMVFMAGFLTSQLYIIPFAERELNISRLQAPLVMSIAAGTELVSRIGFGILGDMKQDIFGDVSFRINRLLMFAVVLLFLSLCTLFIPFTYSFATLSLATAATGLFQGGFSGISVVILADIVGIQHYGTALGISTLLNGIGTLLAPPTIGIAVDNIKKPSVAIYISAGLLFIGASLTFLVEVVARFQKRSIRNE